MLAVTQVKKYYVIAFQYVHHIVCIIIVSKRYMNFPRSTSM